MPKNASKNSPKKVLNLSRRPRRLRQNQTLRDSLAETELRVNQLVQPLFVQDGPTTPIKTMPGQSRLSQKDLLKEIGICMKAGVKSFALFPVVNDPKKDSAGSEAFNKNNLAATTIRKIKAEFPESIIYADIALDPYTDHGHDGVLKNGKILNDESVELLVKQALNMAQAGADFVSPSDMMDGRIGAIRECLDLNGFTDTGIMAYSSKYASSFYGPFRDALSSAPKSGDKKTYQMDFRNKSEALIEAELDYLEGADILMVKPAGSYLDIIQDLNQNFPVPIAAYQVSGEYAMIKFAAKAGAINEKAAMLESLAAIKRAGANLIFTYFAKEVALSKRS